MTTEYIFKVEQHTLEDTEPLSIKIVNGPLVSDKDFESNDFLKAVKMHLDYLLSHKNVMAMNIHFHLENGMNVDLRINKPYLLRQDEHGCITKVYDNEHDTR